MSDRDSIDWRTLNVKRNRRHEALVERFCPKEAAQEPVFRYIKDLMVFAAILGYSNNKKEEIEGSGTIPITLQTYSTDRKDYYIYLIALAYSKDPEILKNDRLIEAVEIFEKFCNGGLAIIDRWLEENPKDPNGISTLVSKINEGFFDFSNEGSAGSADDATF